MVVYPRWRGEHLFSQIYGLLLFGLSPLARGTRAHGIQSRVSARFIPAGAGNTCKYYLVPIIGTVYPPLARGTRYRRAAALSISVYPRWRGEHAVQIFKALPTAVYPRWARGTHRPRTTIRANRRFIPLARGTLLCRFILPACHGLSPLARGTLPYRLPDIIFCGLSPLARGTLPYRLPDIIFAVYPRWRGEHLLLELVECCYSGLSPLARGTQRQVVAALRGRRFIPAGAGNTPRLFKRGRRGSVYPRWRGEHV